MFKTTVKMERKVKEESETLDKTVLVEDDILMIKMEEIKYKVNVLESRMKLLLIKYSTTNIESKIKENDLPSKVKSEPKNHGSDINLVCSDNEQVSAHKCIPLTNTPDLNKKKEECNSTDKLNVTLAFEDDKKIYAHSTILSSKSFQFALEKEGTSNVTLVYEDILQRITMNTKGWFTRVDPEVSRKGGEGQCSMDECLQQDAAAPPPNSCPSWLPQQKSHGHLSRGQVQGECYYERGGEN